MARIEQLARHPQSPTAKWAKYLDEVRQHAVASAEARASRDQQLHRRADYAQAAKSSTTKG